MACCETPAKNSHRDDDEGKEGGKGNLYIKAGRFDRQTRGGGGGTVKRAEFRKRNVCKKRRQRRHAGGIDVVVDARRGLNEEIINMDPPSSLYA